MQFLLDTKNIILILTALLNLILGFFIYFNGRKKKINKIYSWNIVAIVSWVLAMLFFRSATETTSLFWCTILYVAPTFIASSFLYFTYIFPTQKIENLKWRYWIIILSNAYIIFLTILPNMLIHQVNIRPGLEKEIIFNLIPYLFYAFYILICFSLGFVRLFQKYLKSYGKEKTQIIYLLFGYAVAANLAFITNLIMPWIGNFSLNWLGQIFTITMVSFTAYAIIIHNLMDIKLVLRNSFAILAPLITILIGYTAVQYLINLYLPNLADAINVIILVLSILFFIPLKNFYYHIANKYFFSSLYDSQEVLNNLSDKLRSSLDIKIICNVISKTLVNAFHSRAVGILIFNEKKNHYLVQHNYNFKINTQKYFPNDKFLQNKFAKQNKILVLENIKNNIFYKKSKQTIDLLNKLEVEILAPLNIKNKMIGLIVLSQKESGDMYNDEDLKVLKVIGAQTAVALQNSLLYQESLRFGEKLKQEVKIATKDLQDANEKLKLLDKAKTEFVSITSHQLRTPLTGIKGYLSMFLEGDFGKLKTEQKKVMTDVFNNSNRLVRLINIFLNVSRIESGRLKLDKSKFDLIELINEIMRELKLGAEKKNLKLEFNKSKEKIEVFGDRDKIADVVMNLIDNAIKYTKKGKIIISAELNKQTAQIKIKDSGIGIDPQEAKTLFNKFTRGRKIAEINTSGSGLGLFIAKKIIELHNGKIWIQSQGAGKGSKFIFEVPIK